MVFLLWQSFCPDFLFCFFCGHLCYCCSLGPWSVWDRALFSGNINSLISVLERVEGCWKRSLNTRMCYQLMCLVDCAKERGIQKGIAYLVGSTLLAQWSLKGACTIVSYQEFRGWQANCLFQLKINWYLSNLSVPWCLQLLCLSDFLIYIPIIKFFFVAKIFIFIYTRNSEL